MIIVLNNLMIVGKLRIFYIKSVPFPVIINSL